VLSAVKKTKDVFMKKILIIEDDLAIQKAMKITLEQNHYSVKVDSDGQTGYQKALNENLDLILLDLMLPHKNGEDICRDLRDKGVNTPIIVITASKDEIDEITLLKLGANDFLTKPVSIHRLLARVENQMRIHTISEKQIDTFHFGDVDLDFTRQEATKNKQPISLTSKEFKILKLLIQHEEEVVSRTDLLLKVWEYEVDNLPTTRTVDNYILNIRRKIEDDPANPRHLITYYKSGYKFVK
jgi:DNA-binding response OmpR family regulator